MHHLNRSCYFGFSACIERDIASIPNVCITIVIAVENVFSLLCFIALRRTKNIPKLSKNISSVLLAMDCIALFCHNCRRYFKSPVEDLIFMAGFSISFLSYCTVAVMSYERYRSISCPVENLRINQAVVFRVLILVWIMLALSFSLFPAGFCFLVYRTTKRECIMTLSNIITSFTHTIVILSSNTFMILTLMKMKKTPRMNGVSLRMKVFKDNRYIYKSGFAVGCCAVSTVLIGAGYFIIQNVNGDDESRRNSLEVLNTFGSMCHAVAYVVWYRQCRNQIVRLLTCGRRSLPTKDTRSKISTVGRRLQRF